MASAWLGFASAVVVGVLSLIGVIYTGHKQAEAQDTKVEVALTEMRKDIQSLRDETKRHNGVIERTYRLETEVARITDEDRRQNHRLDELERRVTV